MSVAVASGTTALLNASANSSGGTGVAATNSFGVELHWPLYTIYPGAVAFFHSMYFLVWPAVLPHCARSVQEPYKGFSRVQNMCFRANLGSIVHSYGVVLLLTIVLATDEEMRVNRMHRHYNPLGYSAMCLTLGYFSLSVPWSANLLFREKRKDAVPPAMMMHHVMVVCGALVYVLSGVCAFYGTVAFVCMELTNLFFIPRVIYEILYWRVDGCLCTVNGVLLVATFSLCRVGVCTCVAVLFTSDLISFESTHAAEWALVLLAYALFVGVLILSWVWLRQVLTECKSGVDALLQQRKAIERQKAKLDAVAKQQQKAQPTQQKNPPPQPMAPQQPQPKPPAQQQPLASTHPDRSYCVSHGDDHERGLAPAMASSVHSSKSSTPRAQELGRAQGLPICEPAVSKKLKLEPIKAHSGAGGSRGFFSAARGGPSAARIAPAEPSL